MTTYLGRRLVATLPVLLLVTLTTFLLVSLLPGDVVSAIQAATEGIDVEVAESLRVQFGLDRPLLVRYLQWLTRLAAGDLGRSLLGHQPVLGVIVDRFPVTLLLTAGAVVLSLAIGIPVGLAAGLRPNSAFDRVLSALAAVGVAAPGFWLGILLVFLFAQRLHWLPSFGYRGPVEFGLGAMAAHMILPWITLATPRTVEVVRQVRSGMAEVMAQEYVRTARAKGLPERAVVSRHALRNVLIPVVTVTGLSAGHLLSGAVIVETVFLLPGMGTLAVEGVLTRDFPIVQGIVLVGASATILANLLADVAYGILDPRIRYD
ncbi:MAG: ABC transporter permease [Armatimonadota bacterium]|nr:ABC transporter permease [Armatimonadota bacterium]